MGVVDKYNMKSFHQFVEAIEQYSSEAIELAQKIINNTVKQHSSCIDEPTVMYDAIWGNIPYFINIRSSLPGKGLGWIAFLDFLSKVNVDHKFISTDFTTAGQKMFQKAVSMNLIKQEKLESNLGNKTLWLVVANAYSAIEQIAGTKT